MVMVKEVHFAVFYLTLCKEKNIFKKVKNGAKWGSFFTRGRVCAKKFTVLNSAKCGVLFA